MDKYDEEIAYLTEYPDRIETHWAEFTPLFEFVPSGKKMGYGCLTMIAKREAGSRWPHITRGIRNDGIPHCVGDIMVEHLPNFARWQRRIDKLRQNACEGI